MGRCFSGMSENNIIITDSATEGGPRGRLIDLDLAKELDFAEWSYRSHRTGTMQFMVTESEEEGRQCIEDVKNDIRHGCKLSKAFGSILSHYMCSNPLMQVRWNMVPLHQQNMHQ
jgi:hypothetical protein